MELLVSVAIFFAFMFVAISLVLGSYFVARKILGDSQTEPASEIASSVGVRVASLYGLILALVYAQELNDYKDIRGYVAEEAAAIADVFNDVQRYGGPQVYDVQQNLLRYIDDVVHTEWDQLGRTENLSSEAWADWERAYQRILNFKPANDRQHYLQARLLDRTTAIARFRQERSASIRQNFSSVFWPPALIGLILLAIPFYVFPPTRPNLVLLSVFGTYSGVILFFIYAFSNPFEAPARIQPIIFERLQAELAAAQVHPPPNLLRSSNTRH